MTETDTVRAKQYIQKNFRSIRRIQSVAVTLNVSYETLRKTFVRRHGRSMQQYLEEVRVNAARRKIEEGKKLYEVAREVGYANESTLIKHFKKMTGMTPKEYYEIFKDEEDV